MSAVTSSPKPPLSTALLGMIEWTALTLACLTLVVTLNDPIRVFTQNKVAPQLVAIVGVIVLVVGVLLRIAMVNGELEFERWHRLVIRWVLPMTGGAIIGVSCL